MKKVFSMILVVCMLLGTLSMFSYATDSRAMATSYAYYDMDFIAGNLEHLQSYIEKYGHENGEGNPVIQDIEEDDDLTLSTIIASEPDGLHFYMFWEDDSFMALEMTYDEDDLQYVDVYIENDLTSDSYYSCEARVDILNFDPDDKDVRFRMIENYTGVSSSRLSETSNLFLNLAITYFRNLLDYELDMYISEIGFANYCYDHSETVKWTISEPSCFESGEVEYLCKWCGRIMDEDYIPATGKHDLKTTTTPATTTKNGKTVTQCTLCGTVTKSSKVTRIDTVKLNKTTYIYDGSAKKPTVTVKDANGNIIPAKYYTVKYDKGRKEVGTYKVKVTFKDLYSGSVTCTFKITLSSARDLKAVSKKAGIVKLTWSQIDGAKKYVIYSAASKNGPFKKIATTTKPAYNVKDLAAGKRYFLVKAYTKLDGVAYYGAKSNVAGVNVK